MLRRAWLVMLLLLLTVGGACRRGVEERASDVAGASGPQGAGVADGASRAEGSAAAASFVWTATPTLEGIPATPVAGEVHGAPFPVTQVVFEPTRRGWSVVLLEQPLPDPAAPVSGMRFLRVELPAEPAAGAVQQRALAGSGGMFHVDVPGEPGSYTMWTADNAWVLELTEWDVRPWDPAGPEVQAAGRAAGRIAVCYEGGGNFRNAWVAGTFTGALVRYTREPRFEPGCSPAGGG